MKVKKLLLVVFFFITVGNALAQITFQKTFADLYSSWGRSPNDVVQTNDGNYIIGSHISNGSTFSAINIIKTDSAGDIIWNKLYYTSDVIIGFRKNKVLETFNGNYVVASFDFDTTAGGALLLKVDTNGNLIWSKTYGGGKFTDVQQTSDSGYIMAGFAPPVSMFAAGGLYVVKANVNGDTIWTKEIETPISTSSDDYYIREIKTGGFIAATEEGTASNGLDIFVARLDIAGNILWNKIYGGTGDETVYSIAETSDSGFVIAGNSTSFGPSKCGIIIIKADASGNQLWSKSYGDTACNTGMSATLVENDNILISGYSDSCNCPYLLKTDNYGNLLWSKRFYSGAMAQSVNRCSDSGYIMAVGTYPTDIYLFKTDSQGNSGCNESNVATLVYTALVHDTIPVNYFDSVLSRPVIPWGLNVGSYSFANISTLCLSAGVNDPLAESILTIFPNPATNLLHLSLNKNIIAGEVSIYNVMGEKVYSQQLITHSSPLITVNCKLFPAGVYFVRVVDENGSYAAKFVKE